MKGLVSTIAIRPQSEARLPPSTSSAKRTRKQCWAPSMENAMWSASPSGARIAGGSGMVGYHSTERLKGSTRTLLNFSETRATGHHVGDEIGQVVRGQPLLERCRQQQLLVGIVGTEGLAHQRIPSLKAPPIIPSVAHRRRLSDGLLDQRDQK